MSTLHAGTDDPDCKWGWRGQVVAGVLLLFAAELASPSLEVAWSQPPAQMQVSADTASSRGDAQSLAQWGLKRIDSERCVIVTDIESNEIAGILPWMEAVHAAWVQQFGLLPNPSEAKRFRLTGFVMEDQQRFQKAGLLPQDLPPFPFGRHRGLQFWMRQQNSDYYRVHLALHEATHCYMGLLTNRRLPQWFHEGMAERFGTHALNSAGEPQFGVLPKNAAAFPEWSRIDIIDREVRAGRSLTLRQVVSLGEKEFTESFTVPYAWSWGLCQFLCDHPYYRERFLHLCQNLETGDFSQQFGELFLRDRTLLSSEWDQFARRLVYGYDMERNAFQLQPPRELNHEATVNVAADRGWQSTGYRLAAGETVTISASGQAILGSHPRLWTSEPQGISIHYACGVPIGTLLLGLVPEPDSTSTEMVSVPIGSGGEFAAPVSGTLYFRINELGNSLHDNSGSYGVLITRKSAPR
ncbi:hypothetical protein [Planctomicrobium sp. SH664]|uniref:hypothetical protein n=1 Tax=Planctomicrobium sp. SH664 TaxID=3448125 RepID=UPI003F5BB623